MLKKVVLYHYSKENIIKYQKRKEVKKPSLDFVNIPLISVFPHILHLAIMSKRRDGETYSMSQNKQRTKRRKKKWKITVQQ